MRDTVLLRTHGLHGIQQTTDAYAITPGSSLHGTMSSTVAGHQTFLPDSRGYGSAMAWSSKEGTVVADNDALVTVTVVRIDVEREIERV